MCASLAYLEKVHNKDLREVRGCINPLLDIISMNMVIGWPIFNAAMVSMHVTNPR